MAILKKIYPLLALPLLTGCEEAFTPDMPHTPALCVNSLITAGEPVEAKISKSRLYTDSPKIRSQGCRSQDLCQWGVAA